jgi:predicted ATPase/transcriptional regulator with XRE-family HTH domain
MVQQEKTTFGRTLKRYRRSAHLTQEALAERVGYSANYISMLERGVRLPAPATVDALERALDLSSEERIALDAAARREDTGITAASRFPILHSHLIGRDSDVARVVSLLQQPDVHLLTLVGAGGVGKTRLAQQAAVTVMDDFIDGALFVDMAPVSEPGRVPFAIAQALELREAGSGPIDDRLLGYLRRKEILLLLDSLERVLDAAPFISKLLDFCPRLKILVTSRAPLRLRNEREFQVQPLDFPGSGPARSADDLLRYPAVALFIDRTQLVRPGFQNDDDSVRMIAEICRRLDGLPLAIELAAARVRHLPLAELHDQSLHRMQILTGGPRDLPERQQKMASTIAWSYDLLSPTEQLIFRHLSSFVGSWSLQAAQFVCGPQPSRDHLLEALRILVDNSLVILSQARYRMLDTIREFAQQQLVSPGEQQAIQRRHADYYVQFANQAAAALEGGELTDWHRRLEMEEENLRAALDWLTRNDQTELALQLAGSIWRYWQRQGNLGEGRHWLEGGLAKGGSVSDAVRANALWGAIWLAYHQGDYGRAGEESAEYLTLAREMGDPLALRNALTGLGVTAVAQGRYDEGVAYLRQSLEICRGLGENWHLGTSLLNLGRTIMHLGENREGVLLLEEALQVYRVLGNRAFVARTLGYLGNAALLRNDHENAEAFFRESLTEFADLDEKMGIAEGLEGLAAVFAVTERVDRAARLAGAAGAIRDLIAAQPLPLDREAYRAYLDQGRQQLGTGDWSLAWEAGGKMSTDEALALARGSSK